MDTPPTQTPLWLILIDEHNWPNTFSKFEAFQHNYKDLHLDFYKLLYLIDILFIAQGIHIYTAVMYYIIKVL